MNHKISILSALLVCVAAAAISWTAWSNDATEAQDVKIPRDTPQLPIPDPTAQPRSVDPYQDSQLPPVTGSSSIQSTGVPQYYAAEPEYDPLRSSLGQNPIPVPATDPQTAEAIAGYQKLQAEIGGLLQRRQAAKDDSESSSLRKQLIEATAAQFELQQQQRQREIEKLKERLTAVETNAANRIRLKNEIVEKRVADILREPDQLQWESLNTATASNGAAILPPPMAPPQTTAGAPLGPIIHRFPAKKYVPRTVTRVQRETIVNEDGTESIVEKPVQETEYVEVEGTAIVPIPDPSPPTPSSLTHSNALMVPGSLQQPAPPTLSVAEAKARVRIAESKRESMIRRVTNGDADRGEVNTLTAELELAKVMLAQAEAEYEGRTRLLELEVKWQESAHELASAALAETLEVNKRVPNTFPPVKVATQKAAVEQARIGWERAKTLLDVHQKSNAPEETLSGPTLDIGK